MPVFQKIIDLPPYPRGFHLITRSIERGFPELAQVRVGMVQVFIQHTSASLTLNENADPTVRQDFESHFNRMVPQTAPYHHDSEGPDDMPAHLKAALLGSSVLIPVTNGQLNLGTWQGHLPRRTPRPGRESKASADGVGGLLNSFTFTKKSPAIARLFCTSPNQTYTT